MLSSGAAQSKVPSVDFIQMMRWQGAKTHPAKAVFVSRTRKYLDKDTRAHC